MRRSLASACGLLALSSCVKVPIDDVDASFTVASTAWFEEEQTLFAFYEVSAEQGLGEPSVIEITYTTDDEVVPWTNVEAFATVHTHLPVDCGANTMCGSTSIRVPKEPRNVYLRLRYHVDGELSLEPDYENVYAFNVVEAGVPWKNRSLVVYGVFDEQNARVQWRSRNVFPTVHNEQATELGLRRDFTIAGQWFGTAELTTGQNVFGYGSTCPDSFVDAGLNGVSTNERAVFNTEDLPLGASDAAVVCATSTVTDATGTFTTNAIARKNPEVRAAFPVLNSPVDDATPIKFFLGPCDYTISEEHEAMIRQRLQLEDVPTTCIDHWTSPGFVPDLVVQFTDAVEAERPNGHDMVLVVGLQQDEDGVSQAVEEALAQVAPDERDRTSPRLAGAFVLDSDIRGLTLDELAPVTLWCPSTEPTDASGIPDASQRTCAVAPDNPDFNLGPFSFGQLPILPSREQYLDFIDTYSDAQAGKVNSLSYRTPEFATTADHVLLEEYGTATFLNDEIISADSDDAFSYCVSDSFDPFVFRTETMKDPKFVKKLLEICNDKGFDGCAEAIAYGLVPIVYLPEWHDAFREDTYELGIAWDFPFLLRMEYQSTVAGALGVFGLSVPFGISSSSESYYGTEMWTESQFSLEDLLTQCRRFCDHPTFDSAGVYHVTDPFRSTYAQACYLPDYPAVGDSGFPRDP